MSVWSQRAPQACHAEARAREADERRADGGGGNAIAGGENVGEGDEFRHDRSDSSLLQRLGAEDDLVA